MTHAFSIDLEEWYHGLTSTSLSPGLWDGFSPRAEVGSSVLLSLLQRYGVRATVFTVGHLAERSPEVLKAFADAGHRIGLHSYGHQRVSTMTPGEFRSDLRRGLDSLGRVLGPGQSIKGYRAPAFSVTVKMDWVAAELSGAGFVFDSSLVAVKNPLYGDLAAPTLPFVTPTPNGDLLRIPIPVQKVGPFRVPVIGGFYFRMLPYYVIKRMIDASEERGEPVVFYTHPWEYDAAHPYRPANARETISHYAGLQGLSHKLARLLESYQFGSMEEVFGGELNR